VKVPVKQYHKVPLYVLNSPSYRRLQHEHRMTHWINGISLAFALFFILAIIIRG
jgi:hypothetical protein